MGHKNSNVDLWNSLSPDLIGIHIEGKLVFINVAGARLLGASDPGQLVGRPIMDFVHSDCKRIAAERIRLMMEQGAEVPPIEEKWVRLDGTIIDLQVAAILLIYQGKQAVQFIARDITVRKRVERESLKHNDRRPIVGGAHDALIAASS